jgi:type IV pilus assembly protein PilE
MSHPRHSRRRTAGFTLVELMIATSISGVLASIAYPSFSGALQRVRRTEAMVAMLQLQQAQERWRSASRRYGTLAEVGVGSVVPGRNYVLSVADPSSTGYVATAQATGAQARDRACRYLLLGIEGGNTSYRSGETAAASNDEQVNRKCWNL